MSALCVAKGIDMLKYKGNIYHKIRQSSNPESELYDDFSYVDFKNRKELLLSYCGTDDFECCGDCGSCDERNFSETRKYELYKIKVTKKIIEFKDWLSESDEMDLIDRQYFNSLYRRFQSKKCEHKWKTLTGMYGSKRVCTKCGEGKEYKLSPVHKRRLK